MLQIQGWLLRTIKLVCSYSHKLPTIIHHQRACYEGTRRKRQDLHHTMNMLMIVLKRKQNVDIQYNRTYITLYVELVYNNTSSSIQWLGQLSKQHNAHFFSIPDKACMQYLLQENQMVCLRVSDIQQNTSPHDEGRWHQMK